MRLLVHRGVEMCIASKSLTMVAAAEPEPEAPDARGFVDEVETYILVDVDGVLNVGLHDDANAPILLVDSNLKCAKQYKEKQAAGGGAPNPCVDKLVYLADLPLGDGEEDGTTFETFACASPSETSDILVNRLAKIILAAGQNCSVILSSNWRRPKNAARVKKLEECIGNKLERPFSFDGSTPQCLERTAADRLRCMGDYIAAKSSQKAGTGAGRLRFLCLEDFFITGMDGWKCDGTKIESVRAAEEYLKKRGANQDTTVDVKLIHTYAEITTDAGLKAKTGTGLIMPLVNEAMEFLEKPGLAKTFDEHHHGC
eukprot:TRINITY_DN113206_c0_g1_i1.p1 TRINITY_DN113206_c0_g1~~TRINITY_DN113206_c0_g1_i1.p1  ORF type:complete len:335 (+),score=48.02 TRINITY_DN113206_c0_g1_i1:69-1007(+)